MFDTKLLLFLGASAVLIITPGPGVLYIVARGIDQGRTSAIISAFGVGVGNFFQAALASLGLSTILASSEVVFSVLKYLGALYLVYLGVRQFLSSPGKLNDEALMPESSRVTFRRGVVVGTLNPKVTLFFLAFLPQFVNSGKGMIWLQLLSLSTLFVLMGIVSDSCYAPGFGDVGVLVQEA